MATLKEIKRNHRSESLRGSFMVDTVRGELRVRKWPRKRGRPTSAKQLWWIDWFKQANKLAKYVDAATARRAIQLTLGTGMYPRDIILSAMRGRLYNWVDQNGKKWRSMAAIQDISDSLDVLAQEVGSVLVRALDRWRAPDPGDVGDVLTYQGPTAIPTWSGPSSTGVSTVQLGGTPIVADGSAKFYDFDVEPFSAVEFTFDALNLGGAELFFARFSVDNGATFEDAASDYRNIAMTAGAEVVTLESILNISDGSHTGDSWSSHRFENLRAGRCVLHGFSSKSASCRFQGGFATFDGPVTNIRLMAGGGVFIDSGTIRAVGTVAV